jgi:hypothetical protein
MDAPLLAEAAGSFKPFTPHHPLARNHLKRVAIFQIRSLRFNSLFCRMSLSQNRCTLLRDMLLLFPLCMN